MRENERVVIVFKSTNKPKYDPKQGKMTGVEHNEVIYPCHISDMGTELKMTLLDKIDIEAKVLRFNRSIAGAIERVLIDNKPFAIVGRKGFYNRQTVLYVSEVIKHG